MKGKKQRPKVIPHCYRRNLSRTLSNSSVSQLVQLGSYKKRINDLSRNNRFLATALQESRLEAAVQNNILQDCAKECNKILFARLKLNEMAKNLAKFVTDLEEVRGYLNVDILTDINNPLNQKKGAPYDKIRKEPAVSCIEEGAEESSGNEVVAAESFPAVPDHALLHKSDNKQSDVLPNASGSNVGVINEDVIMAPILFADDSEEKKKKSSSKNRSSKMSHDLDKGSLTPELNVDLTCLKLKRKSSRRQSHFIFPGSRSTSRGKTTSSGKENLSEESVTPPSPPFVHGEQTTTKTKGSVEEISHSPINNNISESENPNNLPENPPNLVPVTNQCDTSNVSSLNLTKNPKTAVAPEIQPGESNHTVLLCEDMELTEVIHPVHQIIVNGFPSAANSNLNCDITKKNVAFDFSAVTEEKSIDRETVTERESLNTCPKTSDLPDDDIQIPEINEHDEVQNVGMITFCEPNKGDEDKNIPNRGTKSSLNRPSHRVKPVKYAIFFSSDDSEEDSPFKVVPKKGRNSKRKTVIAGKTVESCKKTGKIANESEMIKSGPLKCTVDILHSGKEEKKLEKKLRKSKDKKSHGKKDLAKQLSQKNTAKQLSQKDLTPSKDANFELSENVKKLMFSPIFSPGILKKTKSNCQTTEKKENLTPLSKVICNDNLEDSTENASESRKVSFAPTDLVCNFKKMSVSKKIAENKKVRRTSKSTLEVDEVFEEEFQSKSSHVGADNSSEIANIQNVNKPCFNFSGETELYTFQLPSNLNVTIVPTTDDLLLSKSTASSSTSQKNDKQLKKVHGAKSVKSTHKLALKKNKDTKSNEQQKISDKIFKEKFNEINVSQLESPMSSNKPVKRKSLFKDLVVDDLKENFHLDCQILEKPKNISQETGKTQINKNSELSARNNCVKKSLSTKCQNKAQGKASMKKLSDKPKLFVPTPEMQKKKHSMAVKSYENSPVLKDTVNLPDVQDAAPTKRRSKQISYREPNLNKKLRRE